MESTLLGHNTRMGDSLAAIIRDEIQREGFIGFHRFMEIALYWPGLGYYRRNHGIFGTEGDFYTAAQLQPVFGELLVSWVKMLAKSSSEHDKMQVLDLGAGREDLRRAFIGWNYRSFDWHSKPLPSSMGGVIVANEFFDALPVNILRKRKTRWRELVVKSANEKFVFDETNDVSPALIEYAELYGSAVPDGGQIEVSLAAGNWITRIGKLLTSGSVLIIDYGYEPRELVRFPEGTLLGYRRHSATGDLLTNPGERDVTAHVNFAYLRERAGEAGLETVCQSSLGKWALSIWDEHELAVRWKKADERWRLQWKQLTFGMGDVFRVLHLKKGESGEVPLQNKNASVAGGAKDS